MTPAERLQELDALLEDLRHENDATVVVVEGEKDVTALRNLGLEGSILRTNQGVPLFALCENISRDHRRVIVLTDWDRTGGQLARLLREGLEANGVDVDLDFRRDLARIAHVKTVEGLDTWYVTLTRQVRPAERPLDRHGPDAPPR